MTGNILYILATNREEAVSFSVQYEKLESKSLSDKPLQEEKGKFLRGSVPCPDSTLESSEEL